MKIGIAGAGLLGRLLALHLSRAGHQLAVFDPAPNALPQFAPDAPALPQAAAFTAAGMLSPIAELDNAEPAVAALGWRSITLWQELIASLPEPRPMLQVAGSLLLAHRGDEGSAQRVLDRIAAAQSQTAWQRAVPEYTGVQKLNAAQLAALEPALAGAAQSWLLGGEGMVDTVAAMLAMHNAAEGVDWRWSQRVTRVDERGDIELADGSKPRFDIVIDVRGVGAQSSTPAIRGEDAQNGTPPIRDEDAQNGTPPIRGEDTQNGTPPIRGEETRNGTPPIRGVRGETIWLHAPAHGLQRPVRLLHPRYRVYIVPRNAETVFIGASEIESQDYSPVSLRSAVELMTAAHSVLPALAEARIIRLDSNCRPATPNNAPLVQWHGQRLAINGLFRHGWLLAPALVEQALQNSPLSSP